MPNGKERKAIRCGYSHAQILCEGLAEAFPGGDVIDVREEIRWGVRQVSDDQQERADLLPYVAFGFRQGTIDLLYRGEDRYDVRRQ